MGLCKGRAKGEGIKCRLCGGQDGDGHPLFCTFLPILHVRALPEFITLMARDRSKGPRCLLWHGGLPGLAAAG